MGQSTHSTELEESFEMFLETLNIKYEQPTHITAELKIGGKIARILLDIGTNLMSLNWAQTNQVQTVKIDKPVEIRMATKNSRATANYSLPQLAPVTPGTRLVF